jgi:hypothetical protein
MGDRLEVPISKFTFTRQGGYVHKLDRRDLFQIIHFWKPATAGDFGQMEAEVTIPATAKPPFTLVFYVMDNNYTGSEPKIDWINRDVRKGHRFRQALVNGQVVWEQDVFEDDVSQHYLVDVTPHLKPGEMSKLAFRLWDKVDSSVTLPGDIYVTEHYATKVATATKKPEKDRHETKSYWGDIALYTDTVPKAEEIPWGYETKLQAPRPQGQVVAVPKPDQISLAVEYANLLGGRWPWPLTQGIPFAPGAGLQLAPDHVLNVWPDGSPQWGTYSLTLYPNSPPAYTLAELATQPSGSARTSGQALVTEYLRADLSLTRGLRVTMPDGRLLDAIQPYLRAGGRDYRAKWSRITMTSHPRGALAMATLEGELFAADGERYGPCRVQATVFEACPYVKLTFRIENQRPEKTFVTEAYGLKLSVPGSRTVAAEDGWATVQMDKGAVTAVVRWFKHLWPNGLTATEDGLDLQFFKPGDTRLPTYNTHPGEAKTQEVWLAFRTSPASVEDYRQLAALVETPPRLDVTRLIRETKVWDELPAITPQLRPEVYAEVEAKLGAYFAKPKENIRLFGEFGNWDNFYWNTLHTMYCLYAMTGERKYFDYAERSIRHHFDVDITHWQPAEGAVATVGAMHGYWGDHSDTPSYSLIQNCDGAFDHWNLTGDPEGRSVGVGIAEYIRTSTSIGRGGSSREQGWPINVMLSAWRQTGEDKYREHAKRLVETALGFEERRRGTYIEVHGSVSYLGPTPFMYGILCTSLRKYHLHTGDDRAAILITRLANAVYEESHDPWHSKTLPNIDYYYSPNPYLRGGDGFTPITTLNLNIAAAQAYAAYVTRDAGMADIAQKSWLAGLHGGSVYPEMAYDLAGVLWWLDELKNQ